MKAGERSLDVYKIVGKLVLEGKEMFDRDIEDTKKKGSKLASGIGKALQAGAKVGAAAVTAATVAIAKMTKDSIAVFSEYEQLAGGVQKIFEDMDTSKIIQDAAGAYKDLGMSANEYLSIINDVGASFASTMGAEAGYEAAKKGLTAISDYVSGTGKNFSELQQKLALITRSTSSYQSIADQFSGILPATSEGFLEQAQAAGVLSDSYKKLTDVPIEEYQQAVTDMLALGVDALGLTGNTAAEATETISGSLTMVKASWQNLLAGLADENANLDTLISNLASSAEAAAHNLAPRITQILNGISTMVTQMAPMLTDAIPVIITQVLPGMLSAGVQLIQSLLLGISQNIDAVTASAIDVCMMLTNTLISNLPLLVSVGMQVITALITGVAQRLPELVPVIAQGIALAWAALVAAAPDFLNAGIELIGSLGDGLMSAFSALFPQVGPWVEQNIYQPIKSVLGVAVDLGIACFRQYPGGISAVQRRKTGGHGSPDRRSQIFSPGGDSDTALYGGVHVPAGPEQPVSGQSPGGALCQLRVDDGVGTLRGLCGAFFRIYPYFRAGVHGGAVHAVALYLREYPLFRGCFEPVSDEDTLIVAET